MSRSPFLGIERNKQDAHEDEKTLFHGKVNQPAITGKHKKRKGLKIKLRERSRTPSTVQSAENRTASREEEEVKSDQEFTAQESQNEVDEPVKKESVEAIKDEKKPNSETKLTKVANEDEVKTPRPREPLKRSPKRTSDQGVVTPKAKKSSSAVKSVTLKKSGEKSPFAKLLTTPKEAKQRRINAFISSGKAENDHSGQKQRRRQESKEIPSTFNQPANKTPPREKSVYIAPLRPANQEVDMIEVMEARKAKEQKAKEQKAKDSQKMKPDKPDQKAKHDKPPSEKRKDSKKDSQKKQQAQSKDQCAIM